MNTEISKIQFLEGTVIKRKFLFNNTCTMMFYLNVKLMIERTT
jgi:hypothetical protein